MKFSKKIKQLKKAGFVFKVDEDEEIISIILDENNLFSRNHQSNELEQKNNAIKCYILTLSELIEREVETIESCYYDEFEQTLKEKYNNVDIIISSLFCDSEIRAKTLAKEQISNRYLTKFNCITLGDSELIADKFYLVIY
jgi:hypothetical protein